MTAERDDIDIDWPGEIDPVRDAISGLLVAIMEGTAEGSPSRKKAMSEAHECHRRIIDAMRDRRVIN